MCMVFCGNYDDELSQIAYCRKHPKKRMWRRYETNWVPELMIKRETIIQSINHLLPKNITV